MLIISAKMCEIGLPYLISLYTQVKRISYIRERQDMTATRHAIAPLTRVLQGDQGDDDADTGRQDPGVLAAAEHLRAPARPRTARRRAQGEMDKVIDILVPIFQAAGRLDSARAPRRLRGGNYLGTISFDPHRVSPSVTVLLGFPTVPSPSRSLRRRLRHSMRRRAHAFPWRGPSRPAAERRRRERSARASSPTERTH